MQSRLRIGALALVALLAAGCGGAAPPVLAGTPAVSPAAAQPSPSPTGPARFAGRISEIGGAARRQMVGNSWHKECPVPIADLRLLRMNYWGFDGALHRGELVVNGGVAEAILGVFHQLFDARFPIKDMELADAYEANDDRLLRSDVTSAFNCRPVTGTTGVWSQHAYGLAVDINPLQNPYVRSDGSVLRRPAKRYTDRSLDLPGMIHPGDIVIRAFAAIGWSWGGTWTTMKDYQHFSANGR